MLTITDDGKEVAVRACHCTLGCLFAYHSINPPLIILSTWLVNQLEPALNTESQNMTSQACRSRTASRTPSSEAPSSSMQAAAMPSKPSIGVAKNFRNAASSSLQGPHFPASSASCSRPHCAPLAADHHHQWCCRRYVTAAAVFAGCQKGPTSSMINRRWKMNQSIMMRRLLVWHHCTVHMGRNGICGGAITSMESLRRRQPQPSPGSPGVRSVPGRMGRPDRWWQ